MPDIRASAVIVEGEKVLLIRHSRRGRTYWVIPGGHVRDFELLDAAVVREIREETGLEIQPGPLVAVFEIRLKIKERWFELNERRSGHVVEFVFLAESFTGTLAAPLGGALVERYDLAEFIAPLRLSTLDIRPTQMRPILQQLASGARLVPQYLGDLTLEATEDRA